MRIADLDTSRGDDCPSGWTKITTPVAACIVPSSNPGCYSAISSSFSIPFSKVCGMAVGYHKGSLDGFDGPSKSINGPYVHGLSITYGNPRKHIWTYAIGQTDSNDLINCPCAKFPGVSPPSCS